MKSFTVLKKGEQRGHLLLDDEEAVRIKALFAVEAGRLVNPPGEPHVFELVRNPDNDPADGPGTTANLPPKEPEGAGGNAEPEGELTGSAT
jgi:hypothetical protein